MHKKLVSPRASSNNVTGISKMSKISSRKASGSPFIKGAGNLIKHNRSRTGQDSVFEERKTVDLGKLEENTRKEMLKKFEVLKKNGYDVATGQ